MDYAKLFEFLLLYANIFFFTLGIPVLCGLVVDVCNRLFNFLMGKGFGRRITIATSIIGTPVHEMGHALMCLVFAHKIDDIALWRPNNKDGNLGYVTHRYSRRNLYHQLGNIFIGLGPIFSGLLVMALCMALAFPQSFFGYTNAAAELISQGDQWDALLKEGGLIVPRMLSEWTNPAIPIWGKIIATILMFAVSLHICLSVADVKGALGGVPLYLVLVLGAGTIEKLAKRLVE